ncbi:MAG: JAB domain-containing protein [Treponemataceae bacterium]
MKITERVTPEVQIQIKDAILEADGNEVFFVGRQNEMGVVDEVFPASRGHDCAVSVNFSALDFGEILIHNHPSGVLKPSNADIEVASRVSENNQGFYIINNDATEIYVVVEPIKLKKNTPLDIEQTALLLSAGGPLDYLYDNFEERPTQIELLKDICKAFNNGRIGIFEAGTGVGKSYAYLLPSMNWALQNKERVILSTGTINLQQQLIEKDIPFAEKILGKSVKAILIKGRQNYICKRRMADASSEKDLFTEESDELKTIIQWAASSETGSKSDLSFLPTESIWTKVNSESDSCMGMRCPFYNDCFVMKVRKQASDANLLVVNHHLLFADLESRLAGLGYEETGVLPPYKHIIFDESHSIENAATSFFSETLTRFRLIKQLNLLYRVRKGAVAGYLFTLERMSNTGTLSSEIMQSILTTKEMYAQIEEKALDVLNYDTTFRISAMTAIKCDALFAQMIDFRTEISKLTSLFRELLEGIDEKEAEIPVVWDTKKILFRLDMMGAFCQQYTEWEDKTDNVFWFEKKRMNSTAKKDSSPFYISFSATPIEIAPLMAQGVFEPLKTIICTSATLQISGSFNFWKNRVGLNFIEQSRIVQNDFASPFPYEQNVLLSIPTDVPLPDNNNFQAFVEQAIVSLILASQGKTLVLFTSYDSLQRACSFARSQLKNEGFTVLRQNEDDRFR